MSVIQTKESKRQQKREYNQYLKSEAWKTKKTEALKFHGRICKKCGSTKYLHVHHMTYERIYHEQMEDFCILCNICHKSYHDSLTGKVSIDSTISFLNDKFAIFKFKKNKKRLVRQKVFIEKTEKEISKLTDRQLRRYKNKLKRVRSKKRKEQHINKNTNRQSYFQSRWQGTPDIIKPERIDKYKTNTKTF